jgi:hypothetical protein
MLRSDESERRIKRQREAKADLDLRPAAGTFGDATRKNNDPYKRKIEISESFSVVERLSLFHSGVCRRRWIMCQLEDRLNTYFGR